MNHDDAYQLLESFVLGALSPDEHRDVELHLASMCPECTARVRELEEVCVDLARNLPQEAPPPHAKENLMAAIQSRGGTQHHVAAPVRRFNVGWLAAGVAAAAALVLFFQLQDMRGKVDALQRELIETQDVTDLLSLPGMSFADMEGVGPNEQAFGKVVVDPMRGEAIVFMYALPENPEGMEYQLWVMRDGEPTSVGTFTVNEDGSAMIMLDELDEEDEMPEFLVTIEPAGGESTPTGMMYLTSPGIQ